MSSEKAIKEAIEQLTDEDLCRDGAGAMGWRKKPPENSVIAASVGGYWELLDGRDQYGLRLLQDPAHGLGMLARIVELGYVWNAVSNSIDTHVGLHYGPGSIWYHGDPDPLRAILMALVAAYRHSQGAIV